MSTRHLSAGSFAATALALLCVVAPARGGIVTFVTPAAYNAATSGNTTLNFTGIAPANGFVTVPVPPGLVIGGVNFSINTAQSNGSLFVVDTGFSNNHFGATVLDSQFSTSTNENILITLPHPVTAAAFDFFTINSEPVTFALSNGASFSATTPGSHGGDFIGVTSSTPFNSVELSQPIGDALALKDFTFGTAVPEPASLTLVAVGGFGLLCFGRRKRQPAARRE
jgi:hypothetical protein